MINKNHSERCPCLDANYGLLVWNTLERISLGIQLDKKVGNEKCFDYYLNNIVFPDNKKGIFEASLNIYNKKIDDLSEYEMIELAMISENPFFYNKKRRPEIVKIRFEQTLIKYNSKK